MSINELNNMETKEKKVYVSPRLGIVQIEMESGIAAGSVNPTAEDGTVSQEWQTGDDNSGDFIW